MPSHPFNYRAAGAESLAPWIVTAAALAAGIGIRKAVSPFDELPLVPLFLAVVLAAYVGGVWPGIAATAAALILDTLVPADIPFAAPYSRRIFAFLIACAIVIFISGRLHRARQAAEEALKSLRESESRFKSFMCNLRSAAWTVDLEGKYTFMNEVGLLMLGKQASEILGRHYRELVPPEAAAACERNYQKALALGSVVASEEVIDLAGREYSLLVSKFPLFTDGRLTGLGSVAIDMTDLRRAEQAQARSHRHLQLITDGIPVAVASFGAGRRLLFANREFRRWCGLGDDEIVGREFAELPGVCTDPLRELLGRALRGEHCRSELSFAAADGERWGDCTVVPQLDRNSVYEVLLLITDITERRRLELQREQILECERAARVESERANRVKDEFLATISHELRTPLNAILGWIELFKRGLAADIGQAIAVIERNARSEALLIDDLLDMGRILVGKLRLQMESVDLLEIVRSSIGVVRPAAEARGISVELRTADPGGQQNRVRADPARLQQILWNLLSNAVKFTPEGGRVEVMISDSLGGLQIEVRDNGKGIDPAFLPFVFDRFRQADGSTRRASGGLGLGLAIVKYLVELHGGTIEAESGGLNQGSTFRLRLPRSFATPMVRPTEPAGASLRGTRVLVVDDDPDAAEIARRFLHDREAEVRTASNADEATVVLEEFAPDVVVSDIGMPGDDGFELIRRVQRRDESRDRSTPVVAMTAYVRDSDRERIRLAGFSAHVAKPIDPVELCRTVAGALQAAQRTVHNPAGTP